MVSWLFFKKREMAIHLCANKNYIVEKKKLIMLGKEINDGNSGLEWVKVDSNVKVEELTFVRCEIVHQK